MKIFLITEAIFYLVFVLNYDVEAVSTGVSNDDVTVGSNVTFTCTVNLTLEYYQNTLKTNYDWVELQPNAILSLNRLVLSDPITINGRQVTETIANISIMDIRGTQGYENDRVFVQISGQDTYYEASFTLYNITQRDFGDYQCEILLNDLGPVKGNILQLRVRAPPSINRKKQIQYRQLLAPAKLECVFASFPKYTNVKWTLHDGSLSQEFQTTQLDGNQLKWMSSIFIPKMSSSQAGKYSCQVDNELGSDTFTFNISVDTFAHIEDAPNHTIVLRSGERRDIECMGVNLASATQKEDVTFVWTLKSGSDTFLVSVNDTLGCEVSFIFNKTEEITLAESILTLGRHVYSWRGQLTCVMTVKGLNYTSAVAIEVSGAPEVNAMSRRYFTFIGSTAVLSCQMSSLLIPDYRWKFSNDSTHRKFIDVPDYLKKSELSTLDVNAAKYMTKLFLLNMTFSDLGFYECSAGNQFGLSRDLIELDTCFSGYSPSSSGLICIDIDECKLKIALCDYGCENLNGSYICTCPEGRSLLSDGKTCEAVDYEELQAKIGQGIGLGAGAVAFVVLVIGIIYYCCRRHKNKKKRDSFMSMVHEKAKRTRSLFMLKMSLSDANAENLNRLEKQESVMKGDEFPRERLKLLDVIGEGEFGCVCRAEALNIIGTGKWELVAVKMCKDIASSSETFGFLKELALVSSIPRHLNVVNYLGCCSTAEPVLLIMEYINGGDLQTYLRQKRTSLFDTDIDYQDSKNNFNDNNNHKGHSFYYRNFAFIEDDSSIATNVNQTECNNNVIIYKPENNKLTNTNVVSDSVHGNFNHGRLKYVRDRAKADGNKLLERHMSLQSTSELLSLIRVNSSSDSATSSQSHESLSLKKSFDEELLNNIDTCQEKLSQHENSVNKSKLEDDNLNRSILEGLNLESSSDRLAKESNTTVYKDHITLRFTQSCPTSILKNEKVRVPTKPTIVTTADTVSVCNSYQGSRNKPWSSRSIANESDAGSHYAGSDYSRFTSIDEDMDISSSDLFAFALQIARGMRHLIQNNIIHRDLAARNILVTDQGICKITDFGLARSVQGTDNYERVSKGALPVRWMAPEALIDRKHSTKSDVWAYGVLLWEIVTLGASPYPGLSAQEVLKYVCSEKIMKRPNHCTQEIYDIMCSCWSYTPDQRPSFEELCNKLEELLEREGDYINLELFQSDLYSCLDSEVIDERL